jgi:hypothetical protein
MSERDTTTKEPNLASDTAALNIYQKLARITGEVGVIAKGGQNREQSYAFIEYAAVAGKLRDLFAKYGVVIVPRMQQVSKQTRLDITSKGGKAGVWALIDFTFTVVNADNPEDKFTVTWTGEAADYGDKATNKAATSALKYYLMRQFNVSEKGDDPDADSHSFNSAKPQPAVGAKPQASPNKAASQKQLDLITTLAKRKGKDDDWLTSVIEKVVSSAGASEVIDKLQELPDATPEAA